MGRAITSAGRKKQDQNLEATKWKKGDPSPNPNGRPPSLLAKLGEKVGVDFQVQLSMADKQKVLEAMLEMTLAQIVKLHNDPNTPAFMVLVAKAISEDHKAGSMSSVETIFNRIHGRPRVTADIELNGEISIPIIKWVE